MHDPDRRRRHRLPVLARLQPEHEGRGDLPLPILGRWGDIRGTPQTVHGPPNWGVRPGDRPQLDGRARRRSERPVDLPERGRRQRSADGDARGSSQNNPPVAEFLGDYVYAAATNDFGAFVWNDVRTAEDCPAIDAWRAALRTKDKKDDPPRPEPNNDCPANFGNSSIFGTAIADPTP